MSDPRTSARPRLSGALTSWRTASVSLLSFSSGLPLGLVWIAIPDWMRKSGVDIRVVGLFQLTQAPWIFKMLWSPLMDRYAVPWLGRRRGWMAVTQVALCALTLALAGLGDHPELPWIVGTLALAIAFASASQDIVIDAYAVELLHKDEQAIAVGLRTALYRAAMYLAGAASITLAGLYSWPAVTAGLALAYLPMFIVTWRAPEPAAPPRVPRSLREAVWLPFLGFLGRHRALEILAFVICYKLADNLAQSLQRPFLHDMGYSDFDRGVALGTVGLVATLVGTFLGGALTSLLGLGRSLWVFGVLQVFSNVGFILVAERAVDRPLMYGAMGFEALSSGLGMGAFGVLLLRLTEKRFSVTQYALFSSLFGLPRMLAGPVAGLAVHALGWSAFFWTTLLAGIPGLVLLARFVPPTMREPAFTVEPPREREPLSAGGLAFRGLVGGFAAAIGTLALMALAGAAERAREDAGGFDFFGALGSLFAPAEVAGWLQLLGAAFAGLVGGLLTAAFCAARRGARASILDA